MEWPGRIGSRCRACPLAIRRSRNPRPDQGANDTLRRPAYAVALRWPGRRPRVARIDADAWTGSPVTGHSSLASARGAWNRVLSPSIHAGAPRRPAHPAPCLHLGSARHATGRTTRRPPFVGISGTRPGANAGPEVRCGSRPARCVCDKTGVVGVVRTGRPDSRAASVGFPVRCSVVAETAATVLHRQGIRQWAARPPGAVRWRGARRSRGCVSVPSWPGRQAAATAGCWPLASGPRRPA